MKERDRGVDRILRYLRDRPEGVEPDEIAREVLHLAGPASKAGEKVIESLLRDEESVERDETGRWRLRPGSGPRVGEEPVVAAVRTSRETGEAVAVSLARCGEAVERLDLERETEGDEDWARAPERVAGFLASSVLVTFDQQKTSRAIEAFVATLPGFEHPRVLSLQRIGKRLFGLRRHPSFQELCDRLGVRESVEGTLAVRLDSLVEIFEKLRAEAESQGLGDLEDLFGAQKRRPLPVDFSRFSFTPAYLASLPRRPGVYVMRDREGRILYVGKTKNLASRVPSYFRESEDRPAKISRILDRLYDLRCIPVGSDLEAVLTEARLIRSEAPEVNVQRKVRSKPSGRRGERNIIVVCPSADPGSAELFLFAGEGPLRQVRVPRDLKEFSAVRKAFGETYWEPAEEPALEPAEIEDLRLARRYFRRHRDALRWVNVDHAAGRRDLVERIKEEVRSLESVD